MRVVPTLQALAEALHVDKTVTEVDLGFNKFGDEGLKARAPPRRPLLAGGLWNGWTQRGDIRSAVEVFCTKHDVVGAFLMP